MLTEENKAIVRKTNEASNEKDLTEYTDQDIR
jgi:hypothetical protein